MIGIIGAMEVEVKKLRELMTNYKEYNKLGRVFYKGEIDNREVVLAISGVGKVNAAITTSIMLEGFEIDYIINLGVAGGLSPLRTLYLVIGAELLYHDVDLTAIGYDYGVLPNTSKSFKSDENLVEIAKDLAIENNYSYVVGNIASGDKFVTNSDCLDHFLSDGIVAVEMEGAAIAHVSSMYHIPFIALRVISDIIDTDGQAADFALVEAKAASAAAVFVHGFLKEFVTE